MTAKIHSISAIAYGLGNASNLSVCFEYDRSDIGATEQLERSRQPGRARAGDYRDFPTTIHGAHKVILLRQKKVAQTIAAGEK